MGILDLFKAVSYSGGNGSSQEEAVVIHTKTTLKGIPAEYAYLQKKFGERGVNWELVGQSKMNMDDGKSIDCLKIKLKDGKVVSLYFDISEFFGKF